MTSLRELCANDEERTVAEQLAEHGIVTDRDVLLADDAILKKIKIPQFVTTRNCAGSQCRHLMISVAMYYTHQSGRFQEMNCSTQALHHSDFQRDFRPWTGF
jgi:hypothetical protein